MSTFTRIDGGLCHVMVASSCDFLTPTPKKMKKLTRDQRYSLYCIMLQEAENTTDYEHGLCRLLFELTHTDFIGTATIQSLDLVELLKYKPKNFINTEEYPYWFPRTAEGWQQRVKALQVCVNKTA